VAGVEPEGDHETSSEKPILQPGNSGVIRRIAGHAEHHPDRITEHNPAAAGPESLGAQPNEPLRLSLDVVGAQVDMCPHRGRRVVGTQSLEEELSAGAGRWVELPANSWLVPSRHRQPVACCQNATS